MIDEGPIKSGYLNIHTIYKASTCVINSSLPIRRSATDADIEIFGSDVVLRQIANGSGGILALQASRAIDRELNRILHPCKPNVDLTRRASRQRDLLDGELVAADCANDFTDKTEELVARDDLVIARADTTVVYHLDAWPRPIGAAEGMTLGIDKELLAINRPDHCCLAHGEGDGAAPQASLLRGWEYCGHLGAIMRLEIGCQPTSIERKAKTLQRMGSEIVIYLGLVELMVASEIACNDRRSNDVVKRKPHCSQQPHYHSKRQCHMAARPAQIMRMHTRRPQLRLRFARTRDTTHQATSQCTVTPVGVGGALELLFPLVFGSSAARWWWCLFCAKAHDATGHYTVDD